MDHVLLTRFNLPSLGRERTIREQPGWLESRVELFERYCLPSVVAQAGAAARWIVYFDPASPAWLRERIEAHVGEGHYVPIFRVQVSREELLDDLRRVVGDPSDELLTSNVDNDDALAGDFCARLQAAPRPAETAVYYFPDGLIRSVDRLYLQHDPANAFPSVRTTWAEGTTCWSEWHTLLRRSMPVVEVGGGPGWLQVVHDRNVSNRRRGRLVGPQQYRSCFAGLLDDMPEPDRAALWRDRVLDRPVRAARDGTVRLAKSTLVGLFGRTRAEAIRRALSR